VTARVLGGLLLLAGCTSWTCRPSTIEVAKKDERATLETKSGVLRTTESGRVEEVIAPRIVREYWIQAADERWYRVSETTYRDAEVGRTLEVCR
jgi:hypothetical protein